MDVTGLIIGLVILALVIAALILAKGTKEGKIK